MPSTSAANESLSPNTIRVKLVKQSYGGLGFLVKQRTLKPFVLVASIVKGGVAEESGLVQIGDIILRINDIDLSDMSYQSAIEVLKAVPIDTPVVLLLRGPEGYTTYLQTTFLENGQPRTVRVTKPIHESLMGRLKKTFSGSSSPMSPVKGIKRLCNGEVDLKDNPGDTYDMDADSTGGVDGSRGSGDGEGGVGYPVVAVEEIGAGRETGAPQVYNGNGGIVGVDIGGKVGGVGNNNTIITADEIPNGTVMKGAGAAASKFAFINEGRVESEEETVLDNGAVGSPKIVLTSPKNRKDKEAEARDEVDRSIPMHRGGPVQVGGGMSREDRQRRFSQKKAIEIVQDEDEITVVVRGDVSVLSEESSTDPNSPRKFIISTGNKNRINFTSNNGNVNVNHSNYDEDSIATDNSSLNGVVTTSTTNNNSSSNGTKYCNNPYGLASAEPTEESADQHENHQNGSRSPKNSAGSISSVGTYREPQRRTSRTGKKNGGRNSGRSSPISAGRVSPTGRTSRGSVSHSPTRGGDDEHHGSRRSLDRKRTSSPTLGRRRSADRRGSVNMSSVTSPKKFAKLKNWLDEKTQVDTLHQKVLANWGGTGQPTQCTMERCFGSLMSQHPHRPNGVARAHDELTVMAKDFIDQYFTSLKKFGTQAHHKRLAEIQACIDRTNTYELTTPELIYGAKLAWRNAPRCIGRIQWSKLQVFDARHILTARGMFEALCNHVKYATNKGNLRSAITIFPQRKDGRRDFRLWNSQLVRYAGYKMEDGTIVGDPASVEFTDICVNLGWKPKYGMFDVLPLVLSAAGSDPEWFDIPPELVMEVNMKHPKYPWFAEMGLKWYVLPAVANMLFDCGGLEFPACPFNGWYMGTEIGARDFCDTSRYNITEKVALKMGLDTRKSTNLWKDRVLVEVNIAVLYSFQTAGVTITDHHSASESFIKHMDNEHKLRGGCPADWVWVVPPMSGSLTEVFHQEMLLYKMKPSYEYQDPAWKTHVWVKDRDKTQNLDKPKRKFGFKELARAVKFSAKLMGKALARRVKCLILYATETGKSERFAETLCEIFKHAFDAKVMCLDEYDVSALEHESLVLFVSSTFGNGDPPENGESFAKGLFELKPSELTNGHSSEGSKLKMSQVRMSVSSTHEVSKDISGNLDIITGPLGNVRYSVFALGSTAYPHFCAFGRYLDQTMRELGAESICQIGEGDELCGQEQSFRQWAEEVFKAACETFCLGDDVNISEATGALSNNDNTWKPNKFRISTVDNGKQPDICEALSKVHSKRIMPCIVTETIQLQSKESDRQTILVRLNTQGAEDELSYVPGDHVGIYPANNSDLVESVLTRLHNAPQPDEIIRTEVLHEVTTPLGSNKTWTQFEKMPVCSLRMAFTHVLDLTTPPSQALLQLLATLATRDIDKERLEVLATDSGTYEDWKYEESPNMLEVLDQFPSLKIPPSLLLTQLPLLQQRYYSISSCPRMHPGEIHATIAVVRFRTKGGAGPIHEGVCSGWLNKCPAGTVVPCMVRTAPTFHLPQNSELPVIMVGPGTGIAPFRSFWEQRFIEVDLANAGFQDKGKFGPMTMYFGCRASKQDNIYGKELAEYHKNGVLSHYHVALSREPNMPKVYVQDVLLNNGNIIYDELITRGGHFYVCGDVSMAHDVQMTLKTILQEHGKMDEKSASDLVIKLRDSDRIHEDIFGVAARRPGEVAERPKDQSQRALQYLNATSKPSKPDTVKEKAVPITPTKRKSVSKPRAPMKNIFVKQRISPEANPS